LSLLKAIAPADEPTAAPTPSTRKTRDDRIERARAYLAKMPPAIAGQGGHAATWCAARKLAQDFELSEEQVFRLLRDDYNQHCQPRWSDKELRHKARDAARKARVANPVEDREHHWTMPENQYSAPSHDDYEHDDSDAPTAPPTVAATIPPTEWVVALPEQIFAPLAEPDYLIAGLIRRGGLLEIQAYGGSGKSWLAVNLALCLASGLPWLGRLAVKLSTVVCLDYENGFYEMARRLQANAKALGLATPVQGIGLITMPDLYMTSDGFEGSVTKLAAAYQVIIIDTLKAASPGVDENDSKMRESLDRLRRVGERTGCTFVVLIHSKKKSNSATEIDHRERGRGSSAIYDAADAQLGVEYEQGKPLQIVQTKARSGRYIEPFQVTIEDGEDGAVHVVATDSPKAEQSTDNADKFEAACLRVLEAVRAWPGSSQIVLREKLGIRNGTVTAALERLQRDGAVRNTGTKSSPKWFPTSIGGRLDE